MISSPVLVKPAEYVKRAITSIAQAKQQIYLLVMVMADDQATSRLVDALCAAAERGVNVNVAVDIFTYSELGGHMKPNTKLSKSVKPATSLERRLKTSGVKFCWLGQNAPTIFSGRTHSKWLIVDDLVFTFGGVNLFDQGIKHNDFMLELKDTVLARRLVHEQQRIITANKNEQSYRSHQFEISYGTVLIDGGLNGESLIYRRACNLAKQSHRVVYVSQYCPTGQLGRALTRIDSALYFNQPDRAKSFNSLVIHLGSIISGHKSIYRRTSYLHAKVMVFELTNGHKVAICGSHNFSHGGVWLGTREIALETADKNLIKQLESFIKDNVA